MPSTSYQYNKPSETYTIDQFIACQSDTEMNYNNLSFIDTISYEFMNLKINYSTYIVTSEAISPSVITHILCCPLVKGQ